MSGDQPFQERVVDGVTVVTFRERRLIDSPAVESLYQALVAMVDLGERRNLLLDFSHVEFVSSAVLNKLVMLNRKLRADGGGLKLANLDGELERIFSLTHLDRAFEIFHSEQEALAAFQGNEA